MAQYETLKYAVYLLANVHKHVLTPCAIAWSRTLA